MPRARPARRPRRAPTLSLAHRTWLVENLLAGVRPADLEAQLAQVLPAARARREVTAAAASPLLAVCDQLARRAQQLELVAALARAHARGEPDAHAVERRTTPTADEFYRRYWAGHRPVVLTDAIAGSPALARWTPAWFRARFGTRLVEVTTGRDADPLYDADIEAHRARMRMDRFIDAVVAAGHSNDLYMVAHNRTLRRPAFRGLLDDIHAPAALVAPPSPTAASLWIGPAGTITSLHHDTTGILFCQIHGRKQIELVSPHETSLLLDVKRGFYSPVDLARLADAEHPAVREILVKRVELGPGEALFIPTGWWHRVTSLSVSISLSLLGFHRPNDFAWYRPGTLAL